MKLALLISFSAAGQTLPEDGVKRVRAIMDAIYSLDHPNAEALCRKWIADEPENAAGYVYLARTKWSEELSRRRALSLERYASPEFFSEDERYRLNVPRGTMDAFRAASAEGIARAKRSQSDAWTRFLLGVAYQNEATLEATFQRNWWSAFRQGTSALRIHSSLADQYPGLADAKFVPGVYRYIAGSVSWKVRWLTALLGFRGSVEGGTADLESVVAGGRITNDDARTMLALVYTREKKFDKAREHLAALHRRFPKNYLVHLDMGSVALQLRRASEAIEIFEDVLRRIDQKSNGYERLDRATVLNHLGVAERGAGHPDRAITHHRRGLEEKSATPLSRAVAHLEIGRALDLQGKRTEALAEYQQVESIPGMPGAAQQARSHIQKPYRNQ
ncbi:MAG: tetratricopeptide repeat protein [Acidobacteria bacterium]|nr:tetratricopeptide repeat protein [Acidobacteriota bacterium]